MLLEVNMDITKKLKALSHETRLEIVRMLLQRSMCVRALARHFNVTEPTISVHLRVLREAGLLYGEKKSYSMHYHVRREELESIAAYFTELSALPAQPSSCSGKGNQCRCHCHRKDNPPK